MHKSLINRHFSVPTHNDAAVILQPCEQSFALPSTFLASQLSAVLRSRPNPVRFVRCDKFNIPFINQLIITLVRVVGPAVNNFLRQIFRHTEVESLFHKHYFMRRSVACVHGDCI